MNKKLFKYITLAVALTVACYGIIDEDGDGLSDVWEELFGAGSLASPDDTDGDKFSNLEESIAGTDPLDPEDRPLIHLAVDQDDPDQFEVTFDGLAGKQYSLQHSSGLSEFTDFGLVWKGYSASMSLSIDRDAKVTNQGSFTAEFWADIATASIDDLVDHANFPNSADGVIALAEGSAPQFLATGYGANISATIQPAESGSYRFYLSSGGPADLLVDGDVVARILPAQKGIRSGEWEKYDTQRSSQIELTAGNRYDIALRYVASIPLQHAEMAWSGPGIDGIQKIGRGDLEKESVTASNIDMGGSESQAYFRLKITGDDQDIDGIPDWEEIALSKHKKVLFFDAETTEGDDDASFLKSELLANVAPAGDPPQISLVGTDAAAFENNAPSTIDDHGSFVMTRTGSQSPLIVKLCFPPLTATGNTVTLCDGACCSLVGSAGDEAAEAVDYQIIDEDGTIITDAVYFEFGETEKSFTVKGIQDGMNEYPETLNLAIKESTDGSYTTSATINGASIQIFDLPDSKDNISIFTGSYSAESGVSTAGSGPVTVTINGPRTEIKLWTEFTGLTSDLSNSHFHKAKPGILSGDVVHGLSAGVIQSMTQDRADGGLTRTEGRLDEYTWDLLSSSGAISSVDFSTSKQVIIDSLFGQNNETPLYFNLHTDNNPGGEIWSFFGLSAGSIGDPGDAEAAAVPNSIGYPLLEGDFLETEVRRFLNQATFGATDEHVAGLLSIIIANRANDPTYHRHEAFKEWLETQIDRVETPQSYLLDLVLANNFQYFTLSGMFDPERNVDANGFTPSLPEWPYVDRTAEKPEHWYLSDEYPVTKASMLNALASPRIITGSYGHSEVESAYWQLYLTARDQLRHKMGFALQQITVASNVDLFIRGNSLGSVNYQDMINAHAFSHYRDVLGTVNWNPVMGHWLSSIKNQKAVDLNGDGIFDTFPDENLARENMQLFSIGLFNLWSDGTLKLTDEGLPKQSYTNDDIKEFAKIITGQGVSYFASTPTIPTWGGQPFAPTNPNFFASHTTRGQNSRVMLYPMKMFGNYHSLGSKTFAGTTIDNMHLDDLDELAVADVEQALDWLAGVPGDGNPDFDMVNSHVSTPAFISRLLIQRFTTSNPSREYLHRVATIFKNSEGHLGETIKAILLDPEARALDLDETEFGIKKSPLESFMQMARSLDARTGIPLTPPENSDPYHDPDSTYTDPNTYLGNFGYPASQLALHERNVRFRNQSARSTGSSGLQMDHMYQDSVFNYYLPDYEPAGIISEKGLVSPEMQIATEPDVVRNINYFYDAIYSSNGLAGNLLSYRAVDQYGLFGGSSDNHRDHMILPLSDLVDRFSLPGRRLVGYWPLDEGSGAVANDASGNGHDGTITDGTWVAGLDGNALDFNGSSSRVSLPMSAFESVNDQVTIAMWVFGDTTQPRRNSVLYANDASGNRALNIHLPWINSVVYWDAGGSSGYDRISKVANTGSFKGQWNHWAFIKNATTGEMSIYLNGVMWHRAAGKVKPMSGITSAILGGQISSLGYDGTIEDVRIYGAALTASEIALIYASAISSFTSGTMNRTAESLADEALVDAVDLRLTNGLFKFRHPYDKTDGLDDNPREIIIDHITSSYDDDDRIEKLKDVLYLLTASSEYQIKK